MFRYVFIVFLLVPGISFAQSESKFILNSTQCKSLISYIRLSDESVKLFDGDPIVMMCTKKRKTVECESTYPESSGSKIQNHVYNIDIDTPPYLIFSTNNKGEVISINYKEQAASYINRIAEPQYIGSKICSMFYVTQDKLYK